MVDVVNTQKEKIDGEYIEPDINMKEDEGELGRVFNCYTKETAVTEYTPMAQSKIVRKAASSKRHLEECGTAYSGGSCESNMECAVTTESA